jgi:hypothetical protein
MLVLKLKLNKNHLKLAVSALAVLIVAAAGFFVWNKPYAVSKYS